MYIHIYLSYLCVCASLSYKERKDVAGFIAYTNRHRNCKNISWSDRKKEISGIKFQLKSNDKMNCSFTWWIHCSTMIYVCVIKSYYYSVAVTSSKTINLICSFWHRRRRCTRKLSSFVFLSPSSCVMSEENRCSLSLDYSVHFFCCVYP